MTGLNSVKNTVVDKENVKLIIFSMRFGLRKFQFT